MNHDDYDEGLVHSHGGFSNETYERSHLPTVADASSVNTPSSVYHDDAHQAE